MQSKIHNESHAKPSPESKEQKQQYMELALRYQTIKVELHALKSFVEKEIWDCRIILCFSDLLEH